MELPEIKLLLHKYEDGKTSVQEEQRIKDLLQEYKDEPSLAAYQSMFAFYDRERHIRMPANSIIMENKKPSLYWFVGIAASMLIIIGVFMATDSSQKEELGTYEDPEVAMQKTKEVLHLVSRYMNSGAQDLKYLNEFENTKNKIITIK